jgi:hypothetical protein
MSFGCVKRFRERAELSARDCPELVHTHGGTRITARDRIYPAQLLSTLDARGSREELIG